MGDSIVIQTNGMGARLLSSVVALNGHDGKRLRTA